MPDGTSGLHQHIEQDGFRLRGLSFSRVDAFSDVVFGFALTLLVVSLEVPKTYEELHRLMLGFVPFGICFCLLMLVWYSHYKFFRRFNLHDVRTVALNAALLFVVLFYVYPLKFLFTFLASGMSGHWSGFFESYHELKELMILFGLGFSAIYGLFALMYANAGRQREHLELTVLEQYLTRSYVAQSIGFAGIGLLSCLLALILPGGWAGMGGLAFWLITPMKRLLRRRVLRETARIRAAEELPVPDEAEIEAV